MAHLTEIEQSSLGSRSMRASVGATPMAWIVALIVGLVRQGAHLVGRALRGARTSPLDHETRSRRFGAY